MSLLHDFLGTEDFSLKDSPMFRKLIARIKNEPIVETISFEDFKMDILSQYGQIENIELGEKTKNGEKYRKIEDESYNNYDSQLL